MITEGGPSLMSVEDAKKFLEKLEKDQDLQKALGVEKTMVQAAEKLKLTFTVEELDDAIEERLKSRGSKFLEGLGFSEVPGF
jgi:hypothetical protein